MQERGRNEFLEEGIPLLRSIVGRRAKVKLGEKASRLPFRGNSSGSSSSRLSHTAQPQIWTTPLANDLAISFRAVAEPDEIIAKIQRYGIDIRDEKVVWGAFARFENKADAYIDTASFLAENREHAARLCVLHAGCVGFPENEALWSEFAAALAANGDPLEAAKVYAFLVDATTAGVHHAWNSATLFAASGEIEDACKLWQLALDRNTSNSTRIKAFTPLFHALALNPITPDIRLNLAASVPAMNEQADWIKRRAGQIVEKHFPAHMFGEYANEDIVFISDILSKMGFDEQLTSGFSDVDISTVSDVRTLASIGIDCARSDRGDKAIDAINALELLAAIQPEAWVHMAAIYSGLGRFDDALKALKHLRPSVDDLRYVVGNIPQEKMGPNALPFLLEIWQISPDSVELAKTTGELAFRHSALDVAIEAFNRVRKAGQGDVSVFHTLGTAYLMTNMPEEAGEAFSQAIKLNPQHRRALICRGHVAYQLGNFEGSADDFEAALEIRGDDAETLYFLVVAKRAMRDHTGAAGLAFRLLGMTEPKTQEYERARILFLTEAALSADSDWMDRAVSFCEQQVSQPHVGFNAKTLLMIFLANVGRLKEASDICELLKVAAPASEIVGVWEAYLNLRLGRIDALPEVKEGQTIDPVTSLKDKLRSTLHAKQYLDMGKWTEAATMMTPVVTSDPNFGGASYIMGRALVMSGKASAAASYIRRAEEMQHFPDELSSLKKLVLAMAKSKSATLRKELKDVEAYKVWANPDKGIAPIVTIGVPAYNESRFLADALNSIWFQSLPFWQCLVVDDVSSDHSRAIAEDYRALDSRFAVVTHEDNKGLAGSRNTALAAANTPYVTFLDGDDFLTFNSLWRRAYVMALHAREDYCAGVYGGMRHCPEMNFADVRLSEPFIHNTRVTFATSGYEAPFNAHAPLLRTEVMKKAGGFTESMRHGAEDWECWIRLLRQGYYFEPSTHLCGLYRQKRGSMVRSLAPHHARAAGSIYEGLANRQPGRSNVFSAPYPAIDAGVRFTKRSIAFAAMAGMAGDKDGFHEIVQGIPLTLEQIERAGLNISQLVKTGVSRFFADTFNTLEGVDRKPYIQMQADRIAGDIASQLEARGAIKSPLLAMDRAAPKGRGGKAAAAEEDETESVAMAAPAYMKLEETALRYATRSKLAAMRNKHAGERCFIIGNGPSLNDLDLTKIGDTAAIGVNGIFYKCDEIDWWPKYYTVEDSSVMKENLERIVAFPAEQKFFPAIYNRLHPHDDNVNFFVMNRGFYEAKSPNFGVPRFSTDFANRAYCGQTVTYINMQLAFHLGFTEVYLIGMDFSYVIPKEFEKKGDMIVSTGDDPNHFHKDYFGKGKSWKDPKLEMVLLNYKMAKLAFEAAGRNIYNATAGGQLELFERVDYNSLF